MKHRQTNENVSVVKGLNKTNEYHIDITRVLISHNFNFAIFFSLLTVLLLIELNSSINVRKL